MKWFLFSIWIALDPVAYAPPDDGNLYMSYEAGPYNTNALCQVAARTYPTPAPVRFQSQLVIMTCLQGLSR
jgi:hypothetical protein